MKSNIRQIISLTLVSLAAFPQLGMAASEESSPSTVNAPKSKSAMGIEESEVANQAKTSPASGSSSESEIPLKAIGAKSAASDSSPWARMGFAMLVLLVSAGGIMIWVKKNKAQASINGRKMEIKLLGQMSLGPKKSIAIVSVAGEALALGVSDQQITLLKNLALLDEDIPTENQANKNFGPVLESANKKAGTTATGAGVGAWFTS